MRKTLIVLLFSGGCGGYPLGEALHQQDMMVDAKEDCQSLRVDLFDDSLETPPFCDVNPVTGVYVRQNCMTHTTDALPCKVCSNFQGCRTSIDDPTVEGVQQAVYCVRHSFFGCGDIKCR